MMAELMRELKDNKVEVQNSPVTATALAELIQLIDKGTISGKMAKQVFAEMWTTKEKPSNLIKKLGLEQITDESAIAKIVDDVIAQNADQVAQYRSGKDKVFGFFVGQVMKLSKGQANPDSVNKLLKEKLK
jgi:aspartyl-tRNA(Asn)/glutamyl-tRNA(Gln) amidotransferase subunit B